MRFANFIGPPARTALTSYFSLPVVPTVFGFDPRLQFVHERDHLVRAEGAGRPAESDPFRSLE